MCRLDCRLASFFAGLGVARRTRIDRKQPLLDQEVDQWRGLGGNVGVAGDVASGRLAIGVDAGEPGDQPASQQGEARLTIAGNARIGICAQQAPARPPHRSRL